MQVGGRMGDKSVHGGRMGDGMGEASAHGPFAFTSLAGGRRFECLDILILPCVGYLKVKHP